MIIAVAYFLLAYLLIALAALESGYRAPSKRRFVVASHLFTAGAFFVFGVLTLTGAVSFA